MGVNLSDIVPRRSHSLQDLSGRVIAIDAFNTFYQFLSGIRMADGTPLQDFKGRPVSHLAGIIYRTSNLVASGVKPVFVFDGEPHELKQGTIESRRERKVKAEKEWKEALEKGDIDRARSKAQQTSRLTSEMISEAERLLGLLGIPVIHAPGDGEAQASVMAQRSHVWAVASQDYDSLLFGAPRVVRSITSTGRRKLPMVKKYVNVEPELVELDLVLEKHRISREQLVDLGILIGTDFNKGVYGVGPKTGLKLIRQEGTAEKVLALKGADIPDLDEIRRIFLEPKTISDYQLEWGIAEEDEIKSMLCGEYGFHEDRVEKALEKFNDYRKATAQKSLDSYF